MALKRNINLLEAWVYTKFQQTQERAIMGGTPGCEAGRQRKTGAWLANDREYSMPIHLTTEDHECSRHVNKNYTKLDKIGVPDRIKRHETEMKREKI